MEVEEVLRLLSEWPGLGLLSYRHPLFNFPVTINYHTWGDAGIDGFTISFNGKELLSKEKIKEQLILDIISLVDYQYAVGDIGRQSSSYLDLAQSLSAIIESIEEGKFEMDFRR